MRNNDKRLLFTAIQMIFFGLSFLSLAGCATPYVAFEKEGVQLYKYKTVYLVHGDGKNDPRALLPVVADNLRNIGFDLKEIKPDGPAEGGQGTGFVISSEGHILTVHHVPEKEKNATVWIDGNRIEAEVVCSDKERDLALLKPKKPLKAEPLFIGFNEPVEMGQDIYAIGFPLSGLLGRSPRLTKGLVSSTVGFKDNPDQMQVSAEIQPGNSGSPLLNKDGKVVGVVTATLNPMAIFQKTGGSLPQNVNFGVKAKSIKAFLESCAEKPPLRKKQAAPATFDTVRKSIAQVYSGLLSADFITSPKMVAGIRYQYIRDVIPRLRVFQVEFYDYDDGSLLLRAGQYRDNLFEGERTTVSNTFKVIKTKFSVPDEPAAPVKAENPEKAEKGARPGP